MLHEEETARRATRIALDLTIDDWVVPLLRAGWHSTAPTYYVLEGLVYYMPTDRVKAHLHSLPSIPGSNLVVTVVNQRMVDIINSFFGNSTSGDVFSNSYEQLKKADAFQLLNYKLPRDTDSTLPHKTKGLPATHSSLSIISSQKFAGAGEYLASQANRARSGVCCHLIRWHR